MKRRTVLVSVGAVVCSGCAGSRPVSDIKNESETIDHEELYRNINEYDGQAVYYEARISGVVTTEESYQELIFTLPGSTMADPRHLYGYWRGSPFRDSDQVEFWGVVDGLESYMSLVGEQTVPAIDIVEMNLL